MRYFLLLILIVCLTGCTSHPADLPDTTADTVPETETAISSQEPVIPDTGQTWMEAAQAYCDALTDNKNNTFQKNVLSETGIRDWLLEEGFIPAGAWPFSVSFIYVPNLEEGEEFLMVGNTHLYSGDDPAIPDGAYETYWFGYVILQEDGWHGKMVGSAW